MSNVVYDIHPNVNEIKSYVAVGPTKDLSITVHKDTFDSGFLVFTIIFGLFLFVVIGITVFFANQNTKLPPPPAPITTTKPNPELHSNIGAATSGNILDDTSSFTTLQQCESSSNTIWTNEKCSCKHPFFGNECSREKHDKSYFAVGTPDFHNLQLSVSNTIKTNSKSFNDKSCSKLCDKSEGCIGFLYDNKICTLLKDNIIVAKDATIPYDMHTESTLYMKSSDNLQFENRIFLGGYTGAFPPRYWLVKETGMYLQLYPGEIRKISFAPIYTKIHGYYTGIYCLHPFSDEDINTILDRGDTSECYIHRQGSNINIPPHWKYKVPLYVVYI